MGLFKKKITAKIPPECQGMEVRIQSSTCTGEKTIGFFNRSTRELMYPELVRSQADIDAFCSRYNVEYKVN